MRAAESITVDVTTADTMESVSYTHLTAHPVIALMPEQNQVTDLGGTLRLGAYPCVLEEGSLARSLYGTDVISERHRHRYEVNNEYREELTSHGMRLCGRSPDQRIVEMMELPDHPYFIRCV